MSRLVAGIDLGTTYSCIAIFRNKNTEIIKTEKGKTTVPSFVCYHDGGKVTVGADAVNRARLLPKNGIYDCKRMIGTQFSTNSLTIHQALWPFDVEEGPNGECIVSLTQDGKLLHLRPEEISANVLRELKKNATRVLEEDLVDVVITVPAYFTHDQKQATKDAALIAGLNVVRLINEPTAAALAFTHQTEPKNRTMLVYDLGGGTFDVSIVKANTDNKIRVIGVSGDNHLGGRDFDNNLLKHVINLIEEKYDIKIEGKIKKRSIKRLETECERIKLELSEREESELELVQLINDRNVELVITRESFVQMNLSLFERTIEIIDELLAQQNVSKSQIDDVLLIGGSTRIPKIEELVINYFQGKKLNKFINRDEAVAVGAAIKAALLSKHPLQKCEDYTLYDVIPHSLGIEVIGENSMSFIIQRNAQLPCLVKKTYYTFMDFQNAIKIKVFEGESTQVVDNTFLGEFVINGITPQQAGEVEITVSFVVDEDGILRVVAEENSKNTKKELTISLKNKPVLNCD